MTPSAGELLYEAWYCSRLNVCSAAAALTAATSIVLVGRVVGDAVLFVALGTYIVYAVDDLLDWRSDEARFPALAALRPWRVLLALCAIPAALATIAVLADARRARIPWQLAGQAGFSLVFCAATVQCPRLERHAHWSLVRAGLVSLVWASVCALTPLWWAGQPTTARALRVVAFVWQLMFVIVLLWEHGERAAHPTADASSDSYLTDPAWHRGLMAFCGSGAAVVAAGVWLEVFPASTLPVVSASVVNWLAIHWWTRLRVHGRVRNDLIVAGNNACCLFVLAAYTGL